MKPSRPRSKTADAAEAALNASLRFLGPRARSEAEITEYLKAKGYSAALAILTLEKLRASRYAGDERFARDWARSRADSRGYGPQRIQQELRAKGIDDALIRAALSETFTGDRERRQAKQILEKQFGRAKLESPEALRRAASFLQRRGYSETVILELLPHYQD